MYPQEITLSGESMVNCILANRIFLKRRMRKWRNKRDEEIIY